MEMRVVALASTEEVRHLPHPSLTRSMIVGGPGGWPQGTIGRRRRDNTPKDSLSLREPIACAYFQESPSRRPQIPYLGLALKLHQ